MTKYSLILALLCMDVAYAAQSAKLAGPPGGAPLVEQEKEVKSPAFSRKNGSRSCG